MGIQASINPDSPLWVTLESIAQSYRHGNKMPEVIDSGYHGKLGVTGPHNDNEDEGEYIRVGFVLPDDIFAEIDNGTYGTLNAFRIYREEQ
jgi:hypothetical protein